MILSAFSAAKRSKASAAWPAAPFQGNENPTMGFRETSSQHGASAEKSWMVKAPARESTLFLARNAAPPFASAAPSRRPPEPTRRATSPAASAPPHTSWSTSAGWLAAFTAP